MIKRVDKSEKYDVFIGRPSEYSNPFILGKDGTRNQVLNKFKIYFHNLDNCNKLLDELDGKIIACWCKLSQNCHGDVIIELYNERKYKNFLNDI